MFPGRGFIPYGTASIAKTGINWGTILGNAQKTLGFINQAIPVFYQIRPMYNNAKTMFRIVKEMGKDDKVKKNQNTVRTQSNYNTPSSYQQNNTPSSTLINSNALTNAPSFFI